MSTIYWDSLEKLVNCVDQIWYESKSGQSRSRELHAITELGRCNLATAPSLCFFAGRVVEVGVTSKWTRFQTSYGEQISNSRLSLDEQIHHLQQLGRLDDISAACIHEVRKLGNRVRHQAAFPTLSQAAFCLAMLKVALPWLADENGAEVQAVCSTHNVTALDQEVQWLLNAETLSARSLHFASLLQGAPNLLSGLNRVEPPYPTDITNWVTQQCIRVKRLDLAGCLIARFLLNGNADAPHLRPDRDSHHRVSYFHRLVALRLSRMGNSALAIEILTDLGRQANYLATDGSPIPLRSYNSHAYAETLGILGGAYKTLWMARREPASLVRTAALYQQALQAEPWNTYLAINAAACLAWAGDVPAARSICSFLIKQLEPTPNGREIGRSANLWNMLTQAEALLLSGQHERAIERYRSVGRQFNETYAGDIRRAIFQVRIHSEHQVLDESTCVTIEQALGM
jgi:hypothetical protein